MMLMMLMILMISSWIMGSLHVPTRYRCGVSHVAVLSLLSFLKVPYPDPWSADGASQTFWQTLRERMAVIFSELRRNAVDLWDPSSLFGCIVVVKHPDLFAQTSQSSQGYWSMFMLDHSCMSKLQCIIGAKVNLLHWSTWCTRTFPQDLSEIFKAFELWAWGVRKFRGFLQDFYSTARELVKNPKAWVRPRVPQILIFNAGKFPPQ